ARSRPASGGARPPQGDRRAGHERVRAARHIGAAPCLRIHDRPAGGTRGLRVLGVAGGEGCCSRAGEYRLAATRVFERSADAASSKSLAGRQDGVVNMITRLADIAHGRSGDKGNHANVAIISYTPAGFDWLRQQVTVEVVAAHFAPLRPSRVERFEAANLLALNFLLHDVLAGGASRSLRSDSQGK